MPLDYALLPKAAGDPTPLSGSGKFYSKDIAGVVQFFYQADDGTVTQLTPGGVPPLLNYPSVVWRPGSPSGADSVQTWAEIETIIAATQGHVIVVVDGSNAPVPATADTECFGRVIFQSYTSNNSNLASIEVADGGRLKNPFTFKTIAIGGTPTIRPFIELNTSGQQCIFREGGQCGLQPGATQPAIDALANFSQVALFEGSNLYNNSGTPGLGLIRVAPNIFFLDARISIAGTPSPPGNYPTDTYEGGAGATLLRIYDSSATPVAQPNFIGGYVDVPMCYAIGTTYQDSGTPSLGASNVEMAINILKRRNTGSGPTASRPAIPADIDTGGMYFDTDLGIPIWSNGAIYVDATGAPA